MESESTQTQLNRIALRIATGILLALFLMAQAPSLFFDYGVYDALKYLQDYGWEGKSSFTRIMLAEGRPLYALLSWIGFSQLEWISQLDVLRWTGWLFTALAGASVVRQAGNVRQLGPWVALTLGCVVIMNPGAAIYVYWSACFPYGLAMVLGLWGGWLWSKQGSIGQRAAGMGLLLLGLMIYQPAALVFLVPGILLREGESGRGWADARVRAILGVILGLAVYFALYRILLATGLVPVNRASRMDLTAPLSQLQPVFQRILPLIFRHFGGLTPGSFGLLLTAFHVAGLLAYVYASGTVKGVVAWVYNALAVVALLAVSLIPVLITAGDYTPFRILTPAYAVLGVLVVTGIARLFRNRPPVLLLAFGCVSFGLAAMCLFIVWYGIVQPRRTEMGLLSAELDRRFETLPSGLIVVEPDRKVPPNRQVYQAHEYGSYELAFTHFAFQYVSLIALETFGVRPGDHPDTPVVNLIDVIPVGSGVAAVPPVYPVVDMRLLVQKLDVPPKPVAKGEERMHPRVGKVVFYEPDVYVSDWFGMFHELGLWLRHEDMGWLIWLSQPSAPTLVLQNLDGSNRTIEVPKGTFPAK